MAEDLTNKDIVFQSEEEFIAYYKPLFDKEYKNKSDLFLLKEIIEVDKELANKQEEGLSVNGLVFDSIADTLKSRGYDLQTMPDEEINAKIKELSRKRTTKLVIAGLVFVGIVYWIVKENRKAAMLVSKII